MSPIRFLERLRAAATHWRAALALAANVAAFEVGMRLGLPGVDGGRVRAFVYGSHASLLRAYDLVAGGGMSHAAVLGVGAVCYIQAKVYLAIARTMFPEVEWLTRDAADRWYLVHVTAATLALIQAFGFAQFLEGVPGAVAAPGVRFLGQTVLLLAGSAVVVGCLGEITIRWLIDGDLEQAPSPRSPLQPLTAAVPAAADPHVVLAARSGIPLVSLVRPVMQLSPVHTIEIPTQAR